MSTTTAPSTPVTNTPATNTPATSTPVTSTPLTSTPLTSTDIPRAVDALDPAAPADFRPRKVAFDYETTPTHWIPDDPHTTHVLNVLHLLLPAGEDWFCEVYRQVVPMLEEGPLRRDVKAFIGQEATHARAHTVALEYLADRDIDPTPFVRFVEGGFRLVRPRSAPTWLPARARSSLERRYLLDQLAGIAAIEHFTALMGWWMLVSPGLDDAGADPDMLALLRWHGAEEVEHRSVAFDAYVALGGGYLRRMIHMLIVFPGMFSLWTVAAGWLMRKDRTLEGARPSFFRFVRAGRRGVLPLTSHLLYAVLRYLRPSYHPHDEGRTEVATSYLAQASGVVPRASRAA